MAMANGHRQWPWPLAMALTMSLNVQKMSLNVTKLLKNTIEKNQGKVP